MKIVAKSIKGQEFLYNAKSAHRVSERSANLICKALNEAKYNLKEGEVWHVHDIDRYDTAYQYVDYQAFTRRNGKLYETAYNW